MKVLIKHIYRICCLPKLLERTYSALSLNKSIYVFVLFTTLLPTNLIWSQSGNVFLKNYNPNLNNVSGKSTSIAQGANGIMYFANPSGVLSYDGKNWGIINVPSIPLVLAANPYNKKIFVGCRKDFGYIDFDIMGKEIYTSISNHYSNFEDISKIIITKEYVYFYCTKQLFCYSITSNNLTEILPPAWNDRYSGFFQNNGGIFVNIEGKGLHDIRGNKLWKINNQLAEQKIIASIYFSDSTTFIYTDGNNSYIFNDKKLYSFTIEDGTYLKDNSVITGINLSKNLFVLSTLSGGCVIINKNTGKTNSIINYQTGLPDNEVYAIATDKLGGLWITHNYGVTRADYQLPITSFSSYPGLSGNLTDVIKVNDKLYVATSEGVFLLSKLVSDTTPLSIKMKRKKTKVRECKSDTIFTNKESKQETVPIPISKETKEESSSKNVFEKVAAVFKKKSHKQKTEEQEVEVVKIKQEEVREEVKYTFAPVATAEPLVYNSPSLSSSYRPCSFEYAYKKIKGIDKKCNQLIFRNGKLFATTITDLFEIENGLAKSIFKGQHINTIYIPENYPNHIYIGTNDGITLIFLENGKTIYRDVGVNVTSMVEDSKFNLWVGGINQVFKFDVNKKGELSRQYTYPIASNNSDYIKVRKIDGSLWFFSSLNIYHYNNKRDIIYKDTTLKLNPNIDKIIYAKDEQRLWIYKDLFWKCYSNNCKEKKNKMMALGIINNIRQIYVDDEHNCWVINDENILYRATHDQIENHHNTNLFIREARNINGELLPINNIVLEHNNSAIRFMITNPYFINESANLYQYILEGVMSEWSQWSSNKIIDFPFLPYGNFKLIVRAKNVFGQITENKEINFSVAYPYWLRWWFYFIEISGVFLLLALSIYFNRNKNASFLSRALLLLSVVISFKLIQAVIESNISVSPVFDFSVSVIMVYVIMIVEKIIITKLTKNTRKVKTRILLEKRRIVEKIKKNRKPILSDNVLK